MHLYQTLAPKIDQWRVAGYPHSAYPVIAEILEWTANPDGSGFRLRPPQVRALETYWYLRLVEGTPHIVEFYRKLFPKKADLVAGIYESDAPAGETNVAVKVTDMLGEQVLKAERVQFPLGKWVQAVNQQGGSGRWRRDVARQPGDILDILTRHSAAAPAVGDAHMVLSI